MNRFFVFILAGFLSLSLNVKVCNAQTMDVVQIVQQLLGQYQNEMEGLDVEKSLGNMSEMSELSGAPGISKMVGKFKDLGGGFMKDSSKKFRPMVPTQIADKLDNPEEVKKFAKEKMSKKVSPDEGGSLARTRETDSMAKTVQQSSAVEAYGSSVASQELAKEAMQAEDNNTDVATSSETLRDNTKMLTAMTIQSIKILGQIRTMEALKSEVGSVDTIRTSKEVDEEALANSKGNEKGSW